MITHLGAATGKKTSAFALQQGSASHEEAACHGRVSLCARAPHGMTPFPAPTPREIDTARQNIEGKTIEGQHKKRRLGASIE